MINRKKMIWTLCTVIGVLLVGAVVLGILNALVAEGKWSFGWRDYRYDESGYTVGEGSIPSDSITSIDVDWIDGSVVVASCQDRYPSVSEIAEGELPESAQVRWRVDENGRLSIKYRKSSWFFAVGSGNREKQLILRIPEAMMEKLTLLELSGVSTNYTLNRVRADALSFSSASGWLLTFEASFDTVSASSESGELSIGADVKGTVSLSSTYGNLTLTSAVTPDTLSLATKHGDVRLTLPADASFCFDWSGKGSVTSDLPTTHAGSRYCIGEGSRSYAITSKKGDLYLSCPR